ncbi:MAG TPA: phage tail protein, partial [Mobilitalea sp.]|nr:phage tail protein [Mobilitalea sp.]
MSAENIGPKIVLEGEKEYRSAISGINRDQKVLTSEMKAMSAEFDGNANSVQALTKKSEILNKEYDAQEKKVRTLRGALDSVKSTYGENSNQVKEWQVKLNNANAELSGLNKEIKANDKYLDEAKASASGTAKSIDEFGKEVKTAGDSTLKTGDIIKANLISGAVIGGIQALGSAMGNAATKTVDLVKGAATYADDMLTMSTQTGVSTDKLQAYNYMAELTDTSMEDMTKSMAKNIKSMSNAQ